MDLVALEPVRRAEFPDCRQNLGLQALPPLRVRFLFGVIDDQALHEAAERSVLLRGANPGAAINVVWQ